MPANLKGIVINEILANPDIINVVGLNMITTGYDTDGDGTVRNTDEFIELYNTSTNTVDIGKWTLRDSAGATFEFPEGTEIAPENHIVVATQYNGTLPNGYFKFDRNSAVWNDSGDVVILSDGSNEIAATYDGATTTINSDNFGNNNEGESLQRFPDGSDATLSATPNPECFLTGTRILTETGYKAVEELQIGDLAQTAYGTLAEIKWIGYQTIEPGNIKNPLRGYPILVKAGALGHNLPCRDLYLSPDHALLVDELLINAGALVNDVSIIKTEPTEAFVYYSVELEHHSLLIAEGTSAESYMPHKEDREGYDNAEEYEQLYPSGSDLMLWPMDYPRVSSKNNVPRFVQQKLLKLTESLNKKLALST